jgi:hypothetical protein
VLWGSNREAGRRRDGPGLVGLTEVERDADGLVTGITSVYDSRQLEPDRKTALVAAAFAP